MFACSQVPFAIFAGTARLCSFPYRSCTCDKTGYNSLCCPLPHHPSASTPSSRCSGTWALCGRPAYPCSQSRNRNRRNGRCISHRPPAEHSYSFGFYFFLLPYSIFLSCLHNRTNSPDASNAEIHEHN